MFERNFTDEELVLKVQMYPDDNLHYVELKICYAEIERQRALIETLEGELACSRVSENTLRSALHGDLKIIPVDESTEWVECK